MIMIKIYITGSGHSIMLKINIVFWVSFTVMNAEAIIYIIFILQSHLH